MKRKKREESKTKTLRNKRTEGLTGQAAAGKKEETDRQKTFEKATMKKIGNAAATKTNDKIYQKDRLSTTPNQNKKRKCQKGQHGSRAPAKQREKPNKGKDKTNKPTPVPQGRRKIPTACDNLGCPHTGLRDMKSLDRAWCAAYLKVGGWLENRACKDCNLEVLNLMKVKGAPVGYICNCGPTGHKMSDENEEKKDYLCDMVLCVPCHTKRSESMHIGPGRRSHRMTHQ